MGIDKRLQAKRRHILRAAARHGASNIRVFGSAARGEATETSDVDFLVDVEPRQSGHLPTGFRSIRQIFSDFAWGLIY